PEGRTVVFAAAEGGRPYLYVRTLDDPRPRRIEGTQNGMQPAISPDGEWVAFLERSTLIRKVRLTGGTPIEVATVPSLSASLAWASNDEILYEVLGEGSGIGRVRASGGQPELLIPLDESVSEFRQRRPFVLQRERLVVYASSTEDGRTTLALYSLVDGRRVRLELEGVQALGLVDGRLVYARSDGNLMAAPFDAGALRVTGAAVELPERVASSAFGTRVALSPAGTLVYRSGSTHDRLVLVDARGAVTPLGALEGGFAGPRFSPDGRRIAVRMGSSGGVVEGASAQDLWLFDRASGQATRLTRTNDASMPEWTADGRRLVYIKRSPGTQGEIWTLPLDGSEEARRLVELDGAPRHAVPTPDGRALVVVVDLVGTAKHELVLVPLDGRSAPRLLAGPSIAGSARRP
ncbi:MAG: hypothetical protein L0221_04055, partial [Chloroflexi bacterium]|nr:hypothetical protein [Chloroflexota bacterium]